MKRLSARILFPALILMYLQGLGQTNIGGTINTYVDVTIVGPCANKITVSNSAGFTSGNSVIIIQMQGATMTETDNSSFGNITSYNSSGLWEKAVIQTVAGNVITLTKNLLNSYSVSGKVQMILLPTYSSANVNSTLTGAAWNGTTGGVIALEVTGTLTLNANIDASGIGFRGGDDIQNCSTECVWFINSSAHFYPIGNWQAGFKGEGVATFISGKELGKGKQTNGGGGGNQAANGGGGGGNYATGGTGGNNNEPAVFNCRGNNNYGIGGLSLNYVDRTRLFLGGGGGAGHGDDGTGTSCPGDGDSGEGGIGGGIVIIIANSITGNGFEILSNGGAGDNSHGDAAGGGGAGGAILINATTITGILTINVSGGNGGDSDNVVDVRCFGSGGGGGSGIVLTSLAFPANVTVISNGGTRGFIRNSTAGCNNTSVATDGAGTADILTGTVIRQSTTPPAAGCGLPVTFIHFTGKAVLDKIELHWATASELDADYFAIERSSDNIDFTGIGRVPASGNTSWRTDYDFIDPLPYPGRNYYRIRQADVTGYEKLTNVILVNPEIRRLVQNIFPNPVNKSTSLQVSFNDPEKDHRLSLLDINSRRISQWIRSRQPAFIMELPLPALNTGIYLLVVETPERREVHKIVVE